MADGLAGGRLPLEELPPPELEPAVAASTVLETGGDLGLSIFWTLEAGSVVDSGCVAFGVEVVAGLGDVVTPAAAAALEVETLEDPSTVGATGSCWQDEMLSNDI